eukprot:EG_transcript_45964
MVPSPPLSPKHSVPFVTASSLDPCPSGLHPCLFWHFKILSALPDVVFGQRLVGATCSRQQGISQISKATEEAFKDVFVHPASDNRFFHCNSPGEGEGFQPGTLDFPCQVDYCAACLK